jgi:hypothetical protein
MDSLLVRFANTGLAIDPVPKYSSSIPLLERLNDSSFTSRNCVPREQERSMEWAMPDDETTRETELENLLCAFDENNDVSGETGAEESADAGKAGVDREYWR